MRNALRERIILDLIAMAQEFDEVMFACTLYYCPFFMFKGDKIGKVPRRQAAAFPKTVFVNRTPQSQPSKLNHPTHSPIAELTDIRCRSSSRHVSFVSLRCLYTSEF